MADEIDARPEWMDRQPEAEPDRRVQPVDAEQPPRLSFPVVGVGASAGGLEAFGEFLTAMRPDAGLAFVFVLHLPPDRDSLLAEVLSHRTAMPVRPADTSNPNSIILVDCPKLHPQHGLRCLLIGSESLLKPASCKIVGSKVPSTICRAMHGSAEITLYNSYSPQRQVAPNSNGHALPTQNAIKVLAALSEAGHDMKEVVKGH